MMRRLTDILPDKPLNIVDLGSGPGVFLHRFARSLQEHFPVSDAVPAELEPERYGGRAEDSVDVHSLQTIYGSGHFHVVTVNAPTHSTSQRFLKVAKKLVSEDGVVIVRSHEKEETLIKKDVDEIFGGWRMQHLDHHPPDYPVEVDRNGRPRRYGKPIIIRPPKG